jgi:hypothetical protein
MIRLTLVLHSLRAQRHCSAPRATASPPRRRPTRPFATVNRRVDPQRLAICSAGQPWQERRARPRRRRRVVQDPPNGCLWIINTVVEIAHFIEQMHSPLIRVHRIGREEADDALLFVPRTVPDALVAGQRYADSSSSHATGREQGANSRSDRLSGGHKHQNVSSTPSLSVRAPRTAVGSGHGAVAELYRPLLASTLAALKRL